MYYVRMSPGYFIIELMVYVFMGITLIMLTFQAMFWFVGHIRSVNMDNFGITRLYAATRALERDLEQASIAVDAWVTKEQKKIQWIHQNKRITWKLKDSKLMRSIAHFNEKDQRWKKEGVAIMTKKLHRCWFEVSQEAGLIKTVQYGIQNKPDYPVFEQTVWPMVGRTLR